MDTRDLPPVSEKTSAASAKEMVLIIDIADALAPALVAAGFERGKGTDRDTFLRNDDEDSVEFDVPLHGNGPWWMVIVLNGEIHSESRVDNLNQALRLLWTYKLIDFVPTRTDAVDVAA